METRPYVSWELMNAFLIDAFKGYGVPEEDAAICADVLLESDRRGIESHGCNRFKPIYIDRIIKGTLLPVTDLEIVRETPTTIVADAHDGMGMVAAHRVMTRLIEKAKTYGMAGGAIRNSTHYGIAGYWATMASKEGMVGITGTNARPSIAPTFGVENMMGTNPLTIALPTDEEFPFCIDCATSIVQRGKIEYWAREGKPTPAGMVVAEDGSTVTDSAEILKMLVDGTAALAGGEFMKALTGLAPDGSPQMYHLGHFFFVIDPAAFCGQETFKKIAGDICRELRASRKAPGYDRIYTAGEKEWLVWQERKDKGVPVGEAVQKELVAVRDTLGLPYRFPFE